MRNRLWYLRENAGTKNYYKTLVLLFILVFVPVADTLAHDHVSPFFMAWIAFFAVWPFRNFMLEHATRSRVVIAVVFVCMILGAVIGSLTKLKLPDWALPAYLSFWGLYLGAFYWLYSDPRLLLDTEEPLTSHMLDELDPSQERTREV